MSVIYKTELFKCAECPLMESVRHYTEDPFEMIFKLTCGENNKIIGYVGATEKDPAIPSWCAFRDE